jgi:DNA-binding response OmpR family regulator
MAKVILSGLDNPYAGQLAGLLASEGHEIRWEDRSFPVQELMKADIVFVGGRRHEYLSVLRLLRRMDPVLPVVIVTPVPETTDWLEVLDAGATDYCVPPFDRTQIRSLISPNARGLAVAAAAGKPV